MSGPWSEVLPFVAVASLATAIVRTSYLRALSPGLAPVQRTGILLATAPLYLLLFTGLAALPRLLSGGNLAPLPPDMLAAKAASHLALYLMLPVIGLVLVLGPRDAWRTALRQLVRVKPTRKHAMSGLAVAAGLSLVLTALLAITRWVPGGDGAGLFVAEGARVFFSNTTPGVALLLAGAAAVAEEALFRGLLLEQARRVLSVRNAVLVQAALFGLIHAGYGSVGHVVAAALFGVLMGLVAVRHGVMPAMIIHFVVNVVILASWSSAGGTLTPLIAVVLFAFALYWIAHTIVSRDQDGSPPTVRVVDDAATGPEA